MIPSTQLAKFDKKFLNIRQRNNIMPAKDMGRLV
jgi:hypothetical protein